MEKNILIIAPHPDDEILGCGGIIRRFYEENDNVYILIITRGTTRLFSDERIAKVREQAIQAHMLLGVKETFFFDFPAPELDTVALAKISESIAEILRRIKVNILFIPHRGDIHIDHFTVFSAALVSARPVDNYTVKEIYSYETLSETEWSAPFPSDTFIPNHFVNIEQYLPYKLDAMACYSGQLKKFPNPRSIEALEALAKFRGSTVGFKLAEAFMTIRTIVK